VVAGLDLALSRRRQLQRDNWPTLAATALGTLLINPVLGLVVGWGVEGVRRGWNVPDSQERS
ncbi:MAG: hypothetical protein R3310_12870, partial [Candidatus Competibacteraceae bacterium]|nr:hypothetical protein [Candidatus Competibacteraceae bacterium]